MIETSKVHGRSHGPSQTKTRGATLLRGCSPDATDAELDAPGIPIFVPCCRNTEQLIRRKSFPDAKKTLTLFHQCNTLCIARSASFQIIGLTWFRHLGAWEPGQRNKVPKRPDIFVRDLSAGATEERGKAEEERSSQESLKIDANRASIFEERLY